MIEAFGNIWDYVDGYNALVITTNGYVRIDGNAVMGRGIALDARNKFPGIDNALGQLLTENGNMVFAILASKVPEWNVRYDILTMPVKPEYGPNMRPGFMAKAELPLIKTSTFELLHYVNSHDNIKKVLMPRPGCGNGGLKWENVRPVIEPILDDRFTVMERD